MSDADGCLRSRARGLAAALEPFAGQVYFSPECHAAYAELGFGPSPRTTSQGVALPDGPAYFTSRGSALGQASGELVASAFAVFKPSVVVAGVEHGWTLTDARTVASARTDGATAQLTRVLGARPEGLDRVAGMLERATAPLRPEGRPLYSGLLALGAPSDPLGRAWRLADMLREYRGDAHTAAWTSAGFDAVEIGLLTELYWGMAMGTYIRTRAWSEDEQATAKETLRSRGLVRDGELTARGRDAREAVEAATDRQMGAALDALGDDLEDLVGVLNGWNQAIRDAGGYPAAGPHDLAEGRAQNG
jgi:hypothetical protein